MQRTHTNTLAFTLVTVALTVLVLLTLSGCATWSPALAGDAADFSDLGLISTKTTQGIRFSLPARQQVSPAAQLPTSLAIAGVQSTTSYPYSVREQRTIAHARWVYVDPGDAGSRDNPIPEDAQRAMLDSLPEIDDVFYVKPRPARASEPLLRALARSALAQDAELLMLYTFSSSVDASDGVMPIDLLTLGVLPDVVSEAQTRAHVILMDARTGFIYALASSDGQSWQLANQWTREEAQRDALKRAKRRALDQAIDRFAPMWTTLRATYW